MSSSDFKQKVASLSQELSSAGCSKEGEKCTYTTIVIAVVIPLIMFLILFFIQPGLVQSKDGNKKVKSNTKVFVWTLLFSALAWGGLYGYTYYFGSGSVCVK